MNHAISDNSLPQLEPDNDPELVKWARYGIAQLQRENDARDAYEQAERDYHHHNRTLDGQSCNRKWCGATPASTARNPGAASIGLRSMKAVASGTMPASAACASSWGLSSGQWMSLWRQHPAVSNRLRKLPTTARFASCQRLSARGRYPKRRMRPGMTALMTSSSSG